MALLFSAVTVTLEDDQAEFLVGGIPKTYSELEGWTAFDNLMNTVDSEHETIIKNRNGDDRNERI